MALYWRGHYKCPLSALERTPAELYQWTFRIDEHWPLSFVLIDQLTWWLSQTLTSTRRIVQINWLNCAIVIKRNPLLMDNSPNNFEISAHRIFTDWLQLIINHPIWSIFIFFLNSIGILVMICALGIEGVLNSKNIISSLRTLSLFLGSSLLFLLLSTSLFEELIIGKPKYSIPGQNPNKEKRFWLDFFFPLIGELVAIPLIGGLLFIPVIILVLLLHTIKINTDIVLVVLIPIIYFLIIKTNIKIIRSVFSKFDGRIYQCVHTPFVFPLNNRAVFMFYIKSVLISIALILFGFIIPSQLVLPYFLIWSYICVFYFSLSYIYTAPLIYLK